MTWLKGQYYEHGCHCSGCGKELTDATVRERVIVPGLPEEPWEDGGRMPGEEMPLAEQIERAAILEMVCKDCYEKILY